MPLNAVVTKRKVKNKTGVDISVPSFQQPAQGKSVKDYHVVVISDLPFFKRAEHSEEDVVQFMVLRDYEAFEKLQNEIRQEFPNLKLPDLPRKFHLFLSQSDIDERQISFDCLMTVLSRNADICTSIPVLLFLGADLLGDRKYHKMRKEYLEKRESKEKRDKAREEQIIGNLEDSGGDLFGEVVEGSSSDALEGGSGARVSADLFGTEDQESSLFGTEQPQETAKNSEEEFQEGGSLARKPVKLSLLGDVDELEPALANPAVQLPPPGTLFADDDSGGEDAKLLDVSDTLDDLLRLTGDDGAKRKKTRESKPPAAAPPSASLFDDDDEDHGVFGNMGKDDILKYIQQNQEADDDLELF